MSAITTHVLDTARGRPASGLAVRVDRLREGGGREEVGHGTTDMEGRVRNLLPPGSAVDVGRYQIVFDTGHYFSEIGTPGFFPEVVVVFEVRDASQHYHVPLLISPFGYSTYRGT